MVEKQITQSLNRTVFPKIIRNKEQKENTVVFAYILLFSLFLLRIMMLSKEERNMNKEGVKIVTIGGGSSYTPELMEGFIKRYDELPIREIWLCDIEDGKEKLEIVGKMAQRMWDASPYDVKVHLTLDRREALPGADFVTTQFRVGLLNARIKDERIPFSYGNVRTGNKWCWRNLQSITYYSSYLRHRRRYEGIMS